MNKHKMYSTLVILLLLWKQDLAECVRIIELRVPRHAIEGGQALLGCQFDLENDPLYSVKWYKDDREFYRYVPSNSEQTSYFPAPGVIVNVARSSSTVVALEHLTKDSGGRYRCEVSGEAPYFATASDSKEVKIYLLPNKSPRMTEVQNEYEEGDRLRVNCTSARSRPRAHLKWLVNNQSVPENYIRGPWEWKSRERPDARVTTLELDFVLTPYHFLEGVLSIECQVTLAPLYHDKVVHHILQSDPTQVNEGPDVIPGVYASSMFVKDSLILDAKPPNKNSLEGIINMLLELQIFWCGLYPKLISNEGSKLTPCAILPSIFILQLI